MLLVYLDLQVSHQHTESVAYVKVNSITISFLDMFLKCSNMVNDNPLLIDKQRNQWCKSTKQLAHI